MSRLHVHNFKWICFSILRLSLISKSHSFNLFVTKLYSEYITSWSSFYDQTGEQSYKTIVRDTKLLKASNYACFPRLHYEPWNLLLLWLRSNTWHVIHFIFNDNVRIFYLSCNITKSKRPAKLSENNWNKRHSNRVQLCHLWRQRLCCYRFFLSLHMNRVPKMIY